LQATTLTLTSFIDTHTSVDSSDRFVLSFRRLSRLSASLDTVEKVGDFFFFIFMIDDGGMWIRRLLWCGLNSGVTSKLFGPRGMAG